MSEPTHIAAYKLDKASKLLQPALAKVYAEYGLSITLTLLMYYAARGIMFAVKTEAERSALILDTWRSYKVALRLQRKAADSTVDNE
jgi:hypothetical protein